MINRDEEAGDPQPRWPVDLDASILRGLADSYSGQVFDAEAVFDELDAKYSAMADAFPGR